MNAKLWNSNFWTTTLSKGFLGLQVYENTHKYSTVQAICKFIPVSLSSSENFLTGVTPCVF